MDEPFVYQAPARSSGMVLAAVAFMGCLAIGIYVGAPWFFFVPALLGLSAVLNFLVNAKTNGLLLAPDYLTLAAWRNPQPIPVDTIDRVEIMSRSDGADMMVHLKSGEAISAYSGDTPPTEPFRQALGSLGIPLEIS